MTKSQKKAISWLEYRAQVTGKSVEEIRAEMRERSKMADRSKSGFASMSRQRLEEVAAKGGRNKAKNNEK